MRYGGIAVSLFIAVAFSSPAFAYNCSASPTVHWFGSTSWQDYVINPLVDNDLSCWSYNSYIASATMSNCSSTQQGWEFTSNNVGSIRRTINVGANDGGSSNWEVTFELDFDDPNDSTANYFRAEVTRTRSGVRQTVATYFRDGSDPNPVCHQGSMTFTAINSDEIKVYLTGARVNSNAHIKVGNVHIRRYY